MMKKKGVSVIIEYVLLVVITIVMAALVYAWMQTYVPRSVPECPNGVSLMVDQINCAGGNLSLTLKNNGQFNVDGFFIKASLAPNEKIATYDLAKKEPGGFFKYNAKLKPGETDSGWIFHYELEATTTNTKETCLGGNLCASLNSFIVCNSTNAAGYDCSWIGLETGGKCVGSATCQDLDETICQGFSMSAAPYCSGLKSVTYYNIYSLEIIPIVYMEQNKRTNFVTCGSAKIRENLICSLFNYP